MRCSKAEEKVAFEWLLWKSNQRHSPMLSNTDVQSEGCERDGFVLKKIGSKIEYLELNSSPHHTKAYIYLGGASKSTHTE